MTPFQQFTPRAGKVLAAFFDGSQEMAGAITNATQGAVYLDTLNPHQTPRLISFATFPGRPSAIPTGWWVVCEQVKGRPAYYGLSAPEFAARFDGGNPPAPFADDAGQEEDS